MNFTQTKKFNGELYRFSGTMHRTKGSANSYANDLRRQGYKARVVGNRSQGWAVYSRKT